MLLIVSVILFTHGCGDKNNCSRSYILTNPVEVYPVKELYEIGDTIWFSMNFSDSIKANITNNWSGDSWDDTIVLASFSFGRNYLGFRKLVDSTQYVNQQPYSWSSFEGEIISGTIVSEFVGGIEYELIYEDNYYQMQFLIICKESGAFICTPFFVSRFLDTDPSSNIKITGECDEEYLADIRFPVNKQIDGSCITNFEVFKQYMNPQLSTDPERLKNESFTFVVK